MLVTSAPGVLALGEATSHLDLADEQRVAQALGQIQLTCIRIAHRPETIAPAQRVVRVRRVTVVEGLGEGGAWVAHPNTGLVTYMVRHELEYHFTPPDFIFVFNPAMPLAIKDNPL